MQNENGYTPVIYANYDVRLPNLNWQCSVSVDTFNFADKTPYKVYWQTEPDEIVNAGEKLIRNHKFYDLILCWNHLVLSECPNARYFPAATVWTHNPNIERKQFQVSYLISSKNMCPGHKFRHIIYDELPDHIGALKIFKHRSPPYLPSKNEVFSDFQFSIITENAEHPNYFTEKLLDAFATKTIPIYWGCHNIGDFFNTDGIVQFKEYDITGLLARLGSLGPKYYHKKMAAIEDNYQRAMKYTDRTGDLIRAINASWTPTIVKVHSGEPNVAPES